MYLFPERLWWVYLFLEVNSDKYLHLENNKKVASVEPEV